MKGTESFCGRLHCSENISQKRNLASLVTMHAFSHTERDGKTFLASISLENPVARDYNLAATEISGKLTRTTGEISLILRPVTNCSYSNLGCEVSVLDVAGEIIQIENVSLSLSKYTSYDGHSVGGNKKGNNLPGLLFSNPENTLQEHGSKTRRSLQGKNLTLEGSSETSDGQPKGEELFSNTLHNLSSELEKLSTDAKGTYSNFNVRLDALSNALRDVSSAQQQSIARTERVLADWNKTVEEMKFVSSKSDLLKTIETVSKSFNYYTFNLYENMETVSISLNYYTFNLHESNRNYTPTFYILRIQFPLKAIETVH